MIHPLEQERIKANGKLPTLRQKFLGEAKFLSTKVINSVQEIGKSFATPYSDLLSSLLAPVVLSHGQVLDEAHPLGDLDLLLLGQLIRGPGDVR